MEATSDLNDIEAKAKITNGAADDSTVAILDSLVTAGPSEPAHEDIPSFNEWAQKRLEEAEKKKSKRPCIKNYLSLLSENGHKF